MGGRVGFDGPKIIKEGLVIYIDASTPNSLVGTTTLRNISPNNYNQYNATINNGALYSDNGKGSIKLDGINDSITIPTHPELKGLTLSFWIYPPSTGGSTIIGDAAQSNTVGYIWIYQSSTNGLQWQFATDTIRSAFDDNNILLNAFDKWTNLTFTADYTNSSSVTLSMYKNGILSSNLTAANIVRPVSRNRFIGAYNGSTLFTSNFFISSFIEYSRALSATEVLQNYNATKGRYGL